MKKTEEKNTYATPPEKYWQTLVDVYFQFHREHFRDEDGFALSPNWREGKIRGMESKGIKELIITLRQITEGKKIEWTEEYAKNEMYRFLQKAYAKTFLRKNFMCCMLNKYKVDVLSTSYNPNLVREILALWYMIIPDYTKDGDKDMAAGEIIVGFLRQQFLLKSIPFINSSVLASVDLIFRTVRDDEFWGKKSLKSIANNLQTVVNIVKSKNGNNNSEGTGKRPNSINAQINTTGDFGEL